MFTQNNWHFHSIQSWLSFKWPSTLTKKTVYNSPWPPSLSPSRYILTFTTNSHSKLDFVSIRYNNALLLFRFYGSILSIITLYLSLLTLFNTRADKKPGISREIKVRISRPKTIPSRFLDEVFWCSLRNKSRPKLEWKLGLFRNL